MFESIIAQDGSIQAIVMMLAGIAYLLRGYLPKRAPKPMPVQQVYRPPSKFWENLLAVILSPFVIGGYLAVCAALLYGLVWVVKYFWSIA